MTAETAATMRAMAVAADLDLPRYLLAGEIQCLLDYVPDLRQRLLLETLWNTGG
ncbi:phage integrase family protein, partial [Klebsiella pneumoniae]|nr:phage integrase family protein [Klebsiella pneumoniae]